MTRKKITRKEIEKLRREFEKDHCGSLQIRAYRMGVLEEMEEELRKQEGKEAE